MYTDGPNIRWVLRTDWCGREKKKSQSGEQEGKNIGSYQSPRDQLIKRDTRWLRRSWKKEQWWWEAAGFREIVIHLVFLIVDGKDARDYPIRLYGSETVWRCSESRSIITTLAVVVVMSPYRRNDSLIKKPTSTLRYMNFCRLTFTFFPVPLAAIQVLYPPSYQMSHNLVLAMRKMTFVINYLIPTYLHFLSVNNNLLYPIVTFISEIDFVSPPLGI